jgi:hypothetical protein
MLTLLAAEAVERPFVTRATAFQEVLHSRFNLILVCRRFAGAISPLWPDLVEVAGAGRCRISAFLRTRSVDEDNVSRAVRFRWSWFRWRLYARRGLGTTFSTCGLSISEPAVPGLFSTARLPVAGRALSGAGTVLALRKEMAFRSFGRATATPSADPAGALGVHDTLEALLKDVLARQNGPDGDPDCTPQPGSQGCLKEPSLYCTALELFTGTMYSNAGLYLKNI